MVLDFFSLHLFPVLSGGPTPSPFLDQFEYPTAGQCFGTWKTITATHFCFSNRTSSDSALHTSVMNPNPQDTYPGPTPPSVLPSRRGGRWSQGVTVKLFTEADK